MIVQQALSIDDVGKPGFYDTRASVEREERAREELEIRAKELYHQASKIVKVAISYRALYEDIANPHDAPEYSSDGKATKTDHPSTVHGSGTEDVGDDAGPVNPTESDDTGGVAA